MAANGFELSFRRKKAIAGVCTSMTVPTEVHAKQSRVADVPVYTQRKPVIPPGPYRSESRGPASLPAMGLCCSGRERKKGYELYTHLAKANLSEMQVVNDSYTTVKIPRRNRLGTLSGTEFTMAYRVSVQAAEIERARFKDLTNIYNLAENLAKDPCETPDSKDKNVPRQDIIQRRYFRDTVRSRDLSLRNHIS